MLHLADNWKRYVKTGVVCLLGYILILSGLVLMNTVNQRGVDNLKMYTVILPEYQELQPVLDAAHNLIPESEGYVTGEDSYFVIPVDSDKMLDVELSSIENGQYIGKIWYSEDGTFNGEPEAYRFTLGHNPITVEPEIRYVKVMISDQPGVHYGLQGISYRNPLDAFARINKGELCTNAGVIWLICLGTFLMDKWKKEKYKKLFSWLGLAASIAITAQYVFHDFLAEDRLFIFMDIGGDTCQQYYPYYLNCVRRIQEGSFGLWNWDYGLGTSLINNISQTLDPFGLLVILGGVALGADKVAKLLLVSQLLKILVSAFLCRYYLKIWGVSDRAANIGGYLYGFNGYLILWGQHYMLGAICIYLPLLLIFIEKLIRGFKVRYVAGLSVVTALSVIYSYYNTYMALLFGGIYCVVRLLDPNWQVKWKERLKKAGLCLLSVITGLMMGAVTLFPAAYYLLNSSSRLDSDTSAFSRFFDGFLSTYSPEQALQILGRLMSNNLYFINGAGQPGWANYYEMPQLCLTIFIYLLLGQLLVQSIKRCKNKKQFLYGALVVIVGLLIILNPGMAIAFNGFAYVVTRYTFVIMPIAALLAAVEWDRLTIHHEFSLIGLLLGLVTSIALLADAYGKATGEVKNYVAVVGILIVFFAILLVLVWKWQKARVYLIPLLAGCIFCSVCKEAYITNNDRLTAYDWSANTGRIWDTMEAIQYLKEQDDSFYRIDKKYADISTFGDSLIAGYSSVTEYNSTTNRNVLQFYWQLYSEAYIWGDAQRLVQWDQETAVNSLSLINVKYILSKETLDEPWLELAYKVENVYIYRNRNAESMASFYTNTIEQSACAAMTEEERRELLPDTLIVEDGHALYHEKDSGDVELGTFSQDGDAICGTVSNEKAGMLLLTIPDQEGWSVYVDGEQADTLNGDYGFLAVELEPGTHSITAEYKIPYAREGIICSVAGILVLSGVCTAMYLSGRGKIGQKKKVQQ